MKTRSILGALTVFAVLAGMFVNPAASIAVVSGANGRVVFVSDRDGDKEIFVMRADGTGVTQLTNNTSNDYDPSISGDGTKIAFITDRDGTPELYTIGIDGSNPFRVTNNAIVESHPSWAPNGSAIAFAGLSGTDSEIYTVKPTGGPLTNLTNNPTAFDTNPSWSPGGQTIAFDSTNRNGSGTDVYTMAKDGTSVKQLTTTGRDSNPSWAPDNKNLAFESARDNGTPGPQVFASLSKPLGVAVTTSKVLVTQFNTDKVKQIDSGGAVSTFATLPANGASIERYIAVSPGLGGFPKDDVYVTVGPNIYQITPDGLTVTLCINVPTLPNGETGITFDTVGTFGNQMILTDRRGPVWAVASCTPSAFTQIGDVGAQIEGPLVAPLSFVPFGGQILMGNEFQNAMFALAPCAPSPCMGVVSTAATTASPEGAVLIPPTVCNMGTSSGAYFIAMKDTNQIFKFDASNFTGLNNDILAPSELTTEIQRMHSDGSSITLSQFWPAFGTPDLEGSAFAPCGSGKSARRAPVRSGATISPRAQRSLNVAGPHEIYKMTSTGASQVRLTNNATDDINPAFSPDGLSVVFQADRDDPNQPACEGTGTCLYEVYKMNASDGSGQTNISNDVAAQDITPDWQAISAVQTVGDFFFDPFSAKPKLGGTVLWDFTGPAQHTATDSSGMGLFDSGTKDPGGYYTFKFVAAGKYPLFCTIHPTMTGEVRVPMTAAPKIGNLTTQFTITWAVTQPPTGYKFDVQIQRPGSPVFVDWKPNTSLKSSSFTADSGTGNYNFQARLRNTVNGFASNYSAPVSITVNP